MESSAICGDIASEPCSGARSTSCGSSNTYSKTEKWEIFHLNGKKKLEIINSNSLTDIERKQNINNLITKNSNDTSRDSYFSEKSKGISYYSTSYNINNNKYILKLRISKIQENNELYVYDLITDQLCINKEPDYKNHPLDRINLEDIDIYRVDDSCGAQIFIGIGGINAKNEIMDSLFKMIMMNSEELTKHSGNIYEECYRSHLIKILHDLWD